MGTISLVLGLVLAPLYPGIVARVKSVVAGRKGPPLAQRYADVWKCLRKGAVYSATTTWVFRAGPIVSLASVLVALLATPLEGGAALLSFPGDLLLVAGLLALSRFATIGAALDTGSAFEGMGSSREAQWGVLTEPALLLALAALSRLAGDVSLSGMVSALSVGSLVHGGFSLALAWCSLAVVFLAENARIPFDDPNTHLELTMIHEVMVLDHGGPDLAYILYGQALKLWVLGGLLVGVLVPATGVWPLDVLMGLGGMGVLAALTGLVESTMARVRLVHVPQLLLSACLMAALALILTVVEWA